MENRYERQLLMDDVGIEGQSKLSKAKVLVVGAGGLGCPALTYLAAAGVGHIVLVDDDQVSLSNLNRQFLYGADDIGKNKAKAARACLIKQNNEIEITAVEDRLSVDNVSELLKKVDVVVDCVDNVATRLLINAHCLKAGIPLVEGGVQGFYGFVTVVTKEGACLECMGYEDQPSRGQQPVIGVTAGTIATIEASECIRILLGYESSLVGKILQYDGVKQTMTKVVIKRSQSCNLH